MILKSSESKYADISSNRAFQTSLVAFELKRMLLAAASTALLLMLLSYSPLDPSWSTWSSTPRLHNWLGRSGSVIADLLLQSFGLAAFAFASLPLALALKLPFREKDDWKLKYLAPFLFLLSVCTLLQSLFPTNWIPWKLKNAGGLFGHAAVIVEGYLIGKVGTRFFSTVALAAAVMMLFQFPLISTSRELGERALAWFTAFLKQLPSMAAARFRQGYEHLESKLRVKEIPIGFGEQATIEVSAHTPPAEVQALPPGEQEELPLVPMATEEPPQLDADGNPMLSVISEPVHVAPVHKIPKTRILKDRNKHYEFPSVSLLSGKAESKAKTVDKSWYLEKGNILVQKLKDFGVEGEVVHISPGPVITVYEFKPASGVKIKEIANLSDDLTLALSVMSVRIVAPIPGKPVVGIEIPSPHRETVYFKDLIQETPFFSGELKIPVALGRLASGEPVTADLASMPHLLVAGTTGTGKSVFINTLITSLLYRFTPQQLKLILVDPKMVELSHYDGIPHLLLPVVVDSKKAVLALRWTVDEMERRYTLMHQLGVRHIDIYNERLKEARKAGQAAEEQAIPYIVVVIDEYADLMAVVPKEVELSIARLAQKARASGIHLVIATQRPSTDVVTGTIKANFPSRISFRVASSIDSKTILDRTGADRLLGHGDLLFHGAGFTSLKRMQGPYLSDNELSRIVDHLKSQGEPEYDERILQAAEELDATGVLVPSGEETDDENRLYDMAVRIVTEKGEASISLIQRHLRIGYNRAASLMEQMEKEGVVGQAAGPAKRRSVLAPKF